MIELVDVVGEAASPLLLMLLLPSRVRPFDDGVDLLPPFKAPGAWSWCRSWFFTDAIQPYGCDVVVSRRAAGRPDSGQRQSRMGKKILGNLAKGGTGRGGER